MTLTRRHPEARSAATHRRPSSFRWRPVTGAALVVVGALLPWATAVLPGGAYPDLATLHLFDAPQQVTGFRLHLVLLAAAVALPRARRAVGFGVVVIALVHIAFLTGHGVLSAGGPVALAGGALLVWAGRHAVPAPRPGLPGRWAAWAVLSAAFAGTLWLVAELLTAGGQSRAANPHGGAEFLAFCGFALALVGALSAYGVWAWLTELAERHRLFAFTVLLGCALALPFTEAGTGYWMTVASTVGVYAATAIGLNVVVGLAGLLDLGYVAFLGIGAFTAANLAHAVPFPVAAAAGAVTAGLLGIVVGAPTLRVRGDYLAIVTLAFGEIFFRAAQNDIGGLTGGANSIPGIPPITMFGVGFDRPVGVLPPGALYYALTVLMVAGAMTALANLRDSRTGRAWAAIREDEDVARAMGVRTGRAKIMAFLVGATMAGLAGAVFAHKLGTAGYESFDFGESVTLLAAVILGGMGTVAGSVVGASLLFVLPEKLREFSDYRLLLFGLALILIMRFRPQGLVSR
ncbi:branched-chain amino acid ABC transporter permease [Spongiactinospora sp. TRM90649]|uniref:branched-chain amino acid ABC transporter permease n=1 Tax=Spongiactinospora sp. TRM90649 TaxID=3031114 RepID=UPI0023F6A905|nr:branched-chain amino acid ABC transporter permease [Spongiactinospora sp. TRM90649]MDF5754554.1 branched-chain amino acid ABC transporter permease [Spongiactinospora sp. TRM90649]